jgi:hypothetical protein
MKSKMKRKHYALQSSIIKTKHIYKIPVSTLEVIITAGRYHKDQNLVFKKYKQHATTIFNME